MALAALLVSSGSLLALPKALGYFIDTLAATDRQASLQSAFFLLLTVIGLYAAAVALRMYLLSWLGERLVADVRRRVFRHRLRLPLAFFDTHPTGDLLSRLTSDAALLETLVGIVLPIGLRSLIQLVGALFLMAWLDWRLTAVFVAVVPLLLVIAVFFGRQVRRTAVAAREEEARLVMRIESSLNALSTVKSFAAESSEAGQFDRNSEISFVSAERLMRAKSLLVFVLFTLSLSLAATMLYAGGLLVLERQTSWSVVAQFVMYAAFAAFGCAGLSEIFGEIRKTAGAAERLLAILQQPPESSRQLQPLPVRPGPGAVRFAQVNFAYPGRPQQSVLEDFSLELRPGETLALVGPSGSGKTTILRLLLRLYDPQAGAIFLDGVDLRDMDPQELRRQIAVVSQEPFIFSGTARDNIRYGAAAATEGQIVEAARRAQADEFISRLPTGYDTPLGDKGQQLSTGQRQRLAIARALLRQTRLLILDEATSALDSENEMLLRQTFAQQRKNRTLLIVAHRLATVQTADRVVVLDHGRIQGEGPHARLLETCPRYARLIALEFEPPS